MEDCKSFTTNGLSFGTCIIVYRVEFEVNSFIFWWKPSLAYSASHTWATNG